VKINQWVEWIGVWGSGKSTAIETVGAYLEKIGFKITKVSSVNLSKKWYILIIQFIIKHPIPNIIIFYILFLKFIEANYNKDSLKIDILKSFLYCWIRRQASILNIYSDYTLWEGEFHLLPLLDLSKMQLKIVIVNILKIHDKSKQIKFILMNINYKSSYERVIKDQETNKNKRFNDKQLEKFETYLIKFILNQKLLIEMLKELNLNFIDINEINK
jgi:hypothetical protein